MLTLTKATLWDCAFGSSTLIVHVEGSTTPGAPALPECIKADVYLPPAFIDEHPEAHSAIAQIVQTFIEAVGVPTVQCWTRAGKKRGWSLSQPGHVYRTPESIPHALVPSPLPGTSHYQFTGRPYGTFPIPSRVSSNAPVTDPVNPPQPASPVKSERSASEEPMSTSMLNLLDTMEEISTLKTKLAGAEL